MATSNAAKGRRGAQARDALNEAVNAEQPCFPWPDYLDPKYHEIWTRTVNTKTGDYWSKGDIPLLVMYCRNDSDVLRLSEEIEMEGEILNNANGNRVINPKIVVRQYAEAKLMALCTKLRLQPSSRMDTKGEDSQLSKTTKARKAAKVISDDGDDLLGGPGSMGVMQ